MNENKITLKKLLITFFVLLAFVSIKAQNTQKDATETVTTYYLIRHAEKDISNHSDKNPNLTEIGVQRAESWANILKEISFDAVYSTNYNRTLQTAKPIAKSNNLKTSIYELSTFNLDKFKEETLGKTVLVVGHSNTTPALVNTLLGIEKYPQINESNYSNIYIITVTRNTVTHSLLKIN